MKKTLSTLLLTGTILSVTLAPALADATYKVYNPRTNKTSTATLGTMGIGGKKYLWGFFLETGQPLCVAAVYNTNTKNGLVGGDCVGIYAFQKFLSGENIDFNKYKYAWREYTAGSLQRNIDSLRKARAEQGWYEYQDNN